MNGNAKLDNDIFEAMMKSALIERYSGEVGELMKEPEEEFSEPFDKRAGKIMRRVWISEQVKGKGKMILKALAGLMIILGISFTVLLTRPKVYAAVSDVVRSVYSDHDSYTGMNGSDTENADFSGDIAPEYIPDGYTLRWKYFGDFCVSLIYLNDDGGDIDYRYGTNDGTKISVNNERVEFSQVQKDGKEYYIYKANDPEDDSTVIWYDGECYFVIDSQLPVDEIVKIAESVPDLQ